MTEGFQIGAWYKPTKNLDQLEWAGKNYYDGKHIPSFRVVSNGPSSLMLCFIVEVEQGYSADDGCIGYGYNRDFAGVQEWLTQFGYELDVERGVKKLNELRAAHSQLEAIFEKNIEELSHRMVPLLRDLDDDIEITKNLYGLK